MSTFLCVPSFRCVQRCRKGKRHRKSTGTHKQEAFILGKMMLRSALLSVFLLLSVDAFYLPGVAPREYMDGERVEVKVNKLTSTITQLVRSNAPMRQIKTHYTSTRAHEHVTC
jgi:hypothetical protein